MSSAISRIAPACAALSCLLAAAAHAGVPAADPKAPVPPTQYRPAVVYQPRPAEPVTPDQAWKEQNRIVGAASGPGPEPTPGHDHAAHGHAGHAMPQAAPADPHAGHAMPAAAADPHAGHTMPAAADAHAGHVMQPAAPAPAPAARQHEGHH